MRRIVILLNECDHPGLKQKDKLDVGRLFHAHPLDRLLECRLKICSPFVKYECSLFSFQRLVPACLGSIIGRRTRNDKGIILFKNQVK